MTLSEILGAAGTIVGIIIGASSKYLGGLLNKKRDDTILRYEVEDLKKRIALIEGKELDKRVSVLEERTGHD